MNRNSMNRVRNSLTNQKPLFNKSPPSSYLNKFKYSNTNTKLIYIIIAITILILIGFFIYLSVCYYNYSNTTCHEKKDFWDYITDFKSNEVCSMKNPPPPPKPQKPIVPLLSILENKKEVFHIANQDYTYDQAKCKCESYGARLATKEEITNAYNNSANWCTYGWADKQSAYYPVQKCEWDKLQSENERLPKNHHKFCGMPGLNGGFFANPTLKFGVNCYGVKPKGNIVKEKQPYCPPMNFCKLESNYQASNKLDTDEIVGFNNEQWNMNM
jgi:hypothetical protein